MSDKVTSGRELIKFSQKLYTYFGNKTFILVLKLDGMKSEMIALEIIDFQLAKTYAIIIIVLQSYAQN